MMTLCLLIAALLSTPPSSPEALYRAGTDAYRAGRYDVAITAFEGALAGADRPDLLFSLAQAHRLEYFADGGSDHLEAAIEAYRGYLEKVPDGKRRVHATQHLSTLVPYLDRLRIERAEGRGAETRTAARVIVTSAVADARVRIDGGVAQPVPAAFEVEPGPHRIEVFADLHRTGVREVVAPTGAPLAVTVDPTPLPGTLTLDAPAGARVLVSGRSIGTSPLEGPVELVPGEHDLVVLARGRRPVVQSIDIGRGEATALAVELEPTTQRWLSIGALGLAVGLGAVGAGTGYFAWDARQQATAIEGRVDNGLTTADLTRYRALEQQRDELRDVTVGLGVAATTLAITGAAMWFFDEPAPPSRPTRRAPDPASDDDTFVTHGADHGHASLARPGLPRSP